MAKCGFEGVGNMMGRLVSLKDGTLAGMKRLDRKVFVYEQLRGILWGDMLDMKLVSSVFILLVLLFSCSVVVAEPDSLSWSQTYGGSGDDWGLSVVAASDGGYAIAGSTTSYGAGAEDFWLVKTDGNGVKQWDKTYGGPSVDIAHSLVAASDNGYVLAGYTASFGAGSLDFWLLKTDASGTVVWNRTYGGSGSDWARAVIGTSDGGYAVAGSTNSFGAGNTDSWLVKTDGSGNMLWNKTYGGAGNDEIWSLASTGDNGYVLAGYTDSFGAGRNDFWLVKTDGSGEMEWSKTYGGPDWDWGYSVVALSNGYALAGRTDSFGAGEDDFWLVRTDSGGGMVWNRTYGGSGDDVAYSLVTSFEGGFTLAGSTTSFGDGYADFWVVQTDSSGNMQWNEKYEGVYVDEARSMVKTFDGAYAIVGGTESLSSGNENVFFVKTTEHTVIPEYTSLVAPSLLFAAILAVIVYKRRIVHRR